MTVNISGGGKTATGTCWVNHLRHTHLKLKTVLLSTPILWADFGVLYFPPGFSTHCQRQLLELCIPGDISWDMELPGQTMMLALVSLTICAP